MRLISTKTRVLQVALATLVVAVVAAVLWPDIVLFQKSQSASTVVMSFQRLDARGLEYVSLDGKKAENMVNFIRSHSRNTWGERSSVAYLVRAYFFNSDQECVYVCRLAASLDETKHLRNLSHDGQRIDERKFERLFSDSDSYPIAKRRIYR